MTRRTGVDTQPSERRRNTWCGFHRPFVRTMHPASHKGSSALFCFALVKASFLACDVGSFWCALNSWMFLCQQCLYFCVILIEPVFVSTGCRLYIYLLIYNPPNNFCGLSWDKTDHVIQNRTMDIRGYPPSNLISVV